MSRSPITTHILDTAAGRPAAGVAITLEQHGAGGWTQLATGTTDDDGRVGDLMDAGTLEPGTFRLTFAVGAYFASRGQSSFYTDVPVIFVIEDTTQHYHVPLLLNPFGYATYRGS